MADEVDVRDLDLELDEAEEQEIEKELLKLFPKKDMETTLPNVIVVTGLPVVNDSKYGKLLKVFTSRIVAVDATAAPPNIKMPKGADGQTIGCAFVEFELPRTAAMVGSKLDNHAFDKKHTLRAYPFDDINRFMQVPDEYVPLEKKAFEEVENLQDWLLDPRAIDQYFLRYANRTEVYFNELGATGQGAEMVVGRDDWTETDVCWSPRGSYLATFHRPGIALWGGPSWKRIVRFSHPGVKLIHFSPCERYLVTLSSSYMDGDDPQDPKAVIVWDVRTGKKLRGFLAPEPASDGGPPPWPLFKWSHEDEYMARMDTDCIQIYAAPTFELLNKRSMRVPSVCGFEWSPSENFLAYHTPEQGSKPARVVIARVPSRKDVRAKNLFNVGDVGLQWSQDGKYLAVKVQRHTSKSKKSSITNFEIFRVCEAQVPVEVLEVPEPFIAFAWEPHGSQFALVSGEGNRHDVKFYSMKNRQLELVNTLTAQQCNQVFWSPRGRLVCLAGLGSSGGGGLLMFYDTQTQEKLGQDSHHNCGAVEWDPTGRYLTTTVSHWDVTLETGFSLFDFQGNKLRSVLKNQFYRFSWRPRPPSVLPHERIKFIEEHLDDYVEEIEEMDKKSKGAARQAEREERERLRGAFESALATAQAAYDAERAERIKLYGYDPDEPSKDVETYEECVETVLSIKESIISVAE